MLSYLNCRLGIIVMVCYLLSVIDFCVSMEPIDSKDCLKFSSEEIFDKYFPESQRCFLNFVTSESTLFNFIDDPKGDSMCQLWSLLPILYPQQLLTNSCFCTALSVFSLCVDKTSQNGYLLKLEEQLGGGMTAVAKTDLSFLGPVVTSILENEVQLENARILSQTLTLNRVKLQQLSKRLVDKQTEELLEATRVCLSSQMFEFLDVPVDCQVQRKGLFSADILAMPFFDSYVMFLRQIHMNNIKVVVNYLQYSAPKGQNDEFLAKQAAGGFVRPAILKRVCVCYPNGMPSMNQNVLMMDMYSGYYGELDTDVMATNVEKLSNFDDFSDIVLQIAASHGQYTDSKGLAIEQGVQALCYPAYYLKAQQTSIGVTNLVIPECSGSKKRISGLQICWNEDKRCIQPVDIPLNTLHVYPVLANDMTSKTAYWASWIDREGASSK